MYEGAEQRAQEQVWSSRELLVAEKVPADAFARLQQAGPAEVKVVASIRVSSGSQSYCIVIADLSWLRG